MAWPVVTVAKGGLPVTTVTGFGTPIEEAANGFGTPVTFVDRGGIPVLQGAGQPQLPAAITGYWVGSDFVSTPRKAVKNRQAATQPLNLIAAPRRKFGITYYYNPTATIADANATAPDGSGDATSVTTASAASWYIQLNPLTTVFPAGTYTAAIWVRWKGTTGDPNFRFGAGVNASAFASGVATTTWQRFTQTFTSNGSTALQVCPMFFPASGNTQANFEIIDFDIYAGSVDLQQPLAGHMMFGNGAGQGAVSVSNGIVSFAGATGAAVQLATAFSAFTAIYIAKNSGSPVNALYNPMLAALASSWTAFGVGQSLMGKHGLQWNNALTTFEQGTGQLLEPRNSAACIAISYDGATAKVYVNGTLMTTNAQVGSAQSLRDLWIGMLQNSFYSNYDLAALAFAPAVLSDADVSLAYRKMKADIASTGLSLPDAITDIAEGDSITRGYSSTNNAGFINLGAPNLSPPGHGPILAVPGTTSVQIVARAAAVDAQIIQAIAAGRKPIVRLLMGTNDFIGGLTASSVAANYAALGDRWRALGAKVVFGTVLPCTSSSYPTFNASRNALNPMIRAMLGVHCDAIADFAADPTMGPDTASDNATNYAGDKIHPTDAGHAILAPISTAARNLAAAA